MVKFLKSPITILLALILSCSAFASSTRTVDADAVTSSDHTKTWTMPASTGTLALSGGSSAFTIQTKTSAYTAVAGDYVKVSGATTITLPTAVGISGQTIVVEKTDADSATNFITLNTTSSQTIDGLASGAAKLYTQYEKVTLVSDNANWMIMSHTYPRQRIADTTSFTFTNITVTAQQSWRQRDGDGLRFFMTLTCSSATAAQVSLNLQGYTLDLTKLATPNDAMVGHSTQLSGGSLGTANLIYDMYSDGTTNSKVYAAFSTSANAYSGANGNSYCATNAPVTIDMYLPISGFLP